MRAATRFSMLTLGLAMLVGLSSNVMTRADDAPATAPAGKVGTVSGKIVDADGKGVKGATVNAVSNEAPAGGRQRGGAGGGGGAARPKPLSTTTTGDDGTYKLDAVPVGKVRITARLQGTGNGMAADIDVTDGKDTKVDDIKLAQRAGGGGGRRGGGAAPAAGGGN